MKKLAAITSAASRGAGRKSAPTGQAERHTAQVVAHKGEALVGLRWRHSDQISSLGKLSERRAPTSDC